MKKITLFIFLCAFVSCSNDDDILEERDEAIITSKEMSYLHNDSSKKWKVTHFYSDYIGKILDEDLTNCMKDDVYTFLSDSRDAEVTYGKNICYSKELNVTKQGTVAKYNLRIQEKILYLSFGTGVYSAIDKKGFSWLATTSCKFISANKMIFTASDLGIVFEKL